MSDNASLGTVIEPEKVIPVAYDVDVAVVGAGMGGLFAALGAGRQGARTVLIDRFGSLGGNIGPAMIIGGGLDHSQARTSLPGGAAGIPKAFLDRLDALRCAPLGTYAEESSIASYVAAQMAEESGVELILAVWAADPIVENDAVTGVFLETKSGRVAVKAKVVIDASGDGDIALRSGAPTITDVPASPSYGPVISEKYLSQAYVPWNDTGVYLLMANVDHAVFKQATQQRVELTPEEQAWVRDRRAFVPGSFGFPQAVVRPIKQAWDDGEFRIQQDVEPLVHVGTSGKLWFYGAGLFGCRINLGGAIRQNDFKQHSQLETAVRAHAFESARFFRKCFPGFEEAYLLTVSAYFGARGGPCIEGEYVLQPQDAADGRRFDDVLFVNRHEVGMNRAHNESFDMPYRMLVPKQIDGLLATGRVASYIRRGHDPGGFRARPVMMALGEATGIAAAIAVSDDLPPRAIDVKKLQRAMLEQGYVLGDDVRLKQLGIA